MSATMPSVPTAEPPISNRRLWFGVLAAPAAWSIAGLANYMISGTNCRSVPVGSSRLLQVAQAPIAVGILTVAAFVIAAAGVVTASGSWSMVRAQGGRRPDAREQPWIGRARFMAFGGLISGLVFLMGLALFGFPALTLHACNQVH